jgi:riboflavin kinase/FMN adenylyltransferase
MSIFCITLRDLSDIYVRVTGRDSTSGEALHNYKQILARKASSDLISCLFRPLFRGLCSNKRALRLKSLISALLLILPSLILSARTIPDLINTETNRLDIYFEPRPSLVESSAIALGFFDGVHPGHQVVITKAVSEASRLGVKSGVVTFRDHPRGLIAGKSPLLLTVIEQRLDLFASLGVDFALVLTFSEELCKLSPRQYVETMLVESLGARSISVGHNHHFGRDREGDAGLLTQFGSQHNFVVHAAPMVLVEGYEVSSSRIRKLINSKDLELANTLLSRPYALRGMVVHGAERGRKLGFPTANVLPADNQLVPPVGVYAGHAVLSNSRGGSQASRTFAAVVNVGFRPTFTAEGVEGEKTATIEAHLLDFQGDLYDQTVEIQFHKFLRDEQKFDGLPSLVKQIGDDISVARAYLAQGLS